MKRMISLLLCMLLMAGMVITASAADDSITLTIEGQTGHNYVAFQIFKGDTGVQNNTEILGSIDWGSGLNYQAFLAAIPYATEPIRNSINADLGTTLAAAFSGADTPQKVAQAMATWGPDLDRIKYFAEFLYDPTLAATAPAGVKVDTLLNEDKKISPDENSNSVTFSKLEPGYYLIMDAEFLTDTMPTPEVNDFYSRFMMTLTTSTTVKVKGNYPTVDKKVNNHITGNYSEHIANQINLDHYYELTGTITSDIADYDTYAYVFVDELGDGLKFKQIEQVLIQSTTATKVLFEAGPDKDAATIFDRYIVPTYDQSGNPNKIAHPFYAGKELKNAIVLGFDDLKKAVGNYTLHSSDKVIVRYSATLTPGAVIAGEGNVNEVELYYGNNPYGGGFGVTTPADARVYTFSMEMTKVNEQGAHLEDAKFLLYHIHTEGNQDHKLYAKVDNNGRIIGWFEDKQDNVAKILARDGEFSDKETALTALDISVLSTSAVTTSTGENGETVYSGGTIHLSGLKDNTEYYLQEIKAPPGGYNLPLSDTEVMISGYTLDGNKVKTLNYDVNSVPQTVTADANGAVVATLSITNMSGTVLPSTGGMGTTVIYAAGAILVLAAVVLLITKKRMMDAE